MRTNWIAIALFLSGVCICPKIAKADALLPRDLISRPSYPRVSDSGYVLIEVWPEVKDITLTAYFLDDLDGRSRNLCEATKRALDRDSQNLASNQNRTATSYRLCMTIKDAVRRGYLRSKLD